MDWSPHGHPTPFLGTLQDNSLQWDAPQDRWCRGSQGSPGSLQDLADTRVKLTIQYRNISNVCVFAQYSAIIRKTCCLTIHRKTFLFPKSSYSRCVHLLTSKRTAIIYYDHLSRDRISPGIRGQKSTLHYQNGGKESPQTVPPSRSYLGGVHSPSGVCLLRKQSLLEKRRRRTYKSSHNNLSKFFHSNMICV